MIRGTEDARSDEELLAAHVQGDSAAFDTLIRRHQSYLWSVACRTSHNPEDAADALQDALFNAHRMAANFRADARVTSWLHRIVVNSCLDRIRRNKVRATATLTESVASGLADRRDETAIVDLSVSIGGALAQLTSDQRDAIIAVDVEGYSIAEAAQMFGVREGTVKSRCARGRLRLAEILGHLRDPESQ